MSSQTQTRNDIETAAIARAQSDPAFRQALVKNSRATIEKEFKVSLPAGVQWKVVEETTSINYLVLPALGDGELSDDALEAVAGGSHMDPVVKSGLPKITHRSFRTRRRPNAPPEPNTIQLPPPKGAPPLF